MSTYIPQDGMKERRHDDQPSRVVALTDGMVPIVITILVLDLA